MDVLFYRVNRYIGKSNSLQIIVLAIAIHSCISIVMIYMHLLYYFDTHFSKHHLQHNHSNIGKIAVMTTDDQLTINLIDNNIIKSNDISDKGWFNDHSKWDQTINCFNNYWTLCSKVMSTQCKPDRSRAIYQFTPIRYDITLYDLHISLRAISDQLIQQSNDAFYGMLVLIKFTDTSHEIIRLQFPSELELWTQKKVRFNNHNKKPIESITSMLTCYGYSGTVSFTDITISPIFDNNNYDIKSSTQIGRWCQHLDKPLNNKMMLKYEVMDINLIKSNKLQTKSNITFVTQSSMDRLIVLERSLQSWTGPVSLSIYIPINNLNEGIQEWHRIYITKKLRNLNLTDDSNVNLVVGLEGDDYPINALRNIAIKHVKTKFMFISDADFQPCPQFNQRFLSIYLNNKYKSKTLFIIPAFEYLEAPQKDDPIPKNKEELMQLIHRQTPIVQPFRQFESSDAHRLTNYWKWYYATDTYPVMAFQDKYEPYIVVEKTDNFPEFDERLKNYGMNKVMHTTELFANNYKFVVMPNVWTIHLPHKTSHYFQTFLQNVETKLMNRAVRFQVLRDIIDKYKINIYNCE
ncbi:xylosyl- and glucuronyltransferase LARGE2s-like [Oppia nitens]|uniref:xylosyl- and glucuronyltransferase LARGE2s-like n=1 Tax=Oppia nitens TaxID=1686743 RepID=UPI0023D98DB3|nr:xylosyl- and glucuronyltransferase LARGE2s-like [Oppia nitens]